MAAEQARSHATRLALAMGITFYVVRSREGRLLPVQLPSDDYEILATIAPPSSGHKQTSSKYRSIRSALPPAIPKFSNASSSESSPISR
jgi:hypothetical protein